ncbi:MAG: FAD-binding oxidoreductase, partial [Nocardioidaceae bacterium]
GLATPLGFVSDTGVAGLTLGGGLGYLSRRFGWTVDNLLDVEIVTADGRVRRASRDEHPELFWAVRGAGANLGAVTTFTFRLHEVGPTVYCGLIGWPFDRADEILRAYRAITAGAPPELTVFLIMRAAPPSPPISMPDVESHLAGFALAFLDELDTAAQRSSTSVD